MFTKLFPTPCFAPDEIGQGGDITPDPEVGQGEEQSFWTAPDGTAYATPDELGKAWNDSHMMRSDYTRKTQALAKEREEFDGRRSEFEKSYESKSKEYEQFDRLMRERPDVYQKMKQELQGPPSQRATMSMVEKMFEDKYGPQMEEFREWKQKQEMNTELEAIYGEFSEKYPDFDRSTVDPALDGLSEGGYRALVDMIYHANRGRAASPADVERRMTEQLEKKKSAGLAPGGGRSAPSGNKNYTAISDVANDLMTGS